MSLTKPTIVAADNAGNDTDYAAWVKVNLLFDAANAGAMQGFKNRLMNGCGAINQRLASSNADDTYAHDRWNILTQTGTVAASTVTNPENGAATAVRITQSQASAQRFGFSQIIESANCRDLRGAQATLSGRLRCSASTTLRFAILEWTGTADAPTSDIVNDWTSATYTAGNFFISTTTNVLATGSLAVTANTWADLTALAATIGASANNLIVLVWTDSTQAQNVTLDFHSMQLEPGASATKFETRSVAVEQILCERYFERQGGDSTLETFAVLQCLSTTQARGSVRFRTQKRTTPTMTFAGTVGNWAADAAGGSQTALTAISAGRRTLNQFEPEVTVASGLVAGNASVLRANSSTAVYWTADAEL